MNKLILRSKMGMLKSMMCARPSGDPTNRSEKALGLPGMRGKGHVVERNGEVIVTNAKYKARVSVGDVERMAAYLVDIAAPLGADGERLVGVLVMLTGSKPKTSKVVADEELTTKHELRVAHVNPSEELKLDNVKTVKEVLRVTR